MTRHYIYCKKADFKKISETFHISPILARIIRNRDLVSEEEIEEYLNGRTDRLSDPFLMKGVGKAVPLILNAVNRNEHIRIIGDYDADGVCSSYILKQYLNLIGGSVDVRLPDRMEEGYGMNPEMIREAAKDRVDLIITCDNGVSSYDAVKEAGKRGIPVIISDHHEVPMPLIDADAVINPKQPGDTSPYKELCGAGVAYKIVSALNTELECRLKDTGKKSILLEQTSRLLDDLLPFAGIATIADVVPLTGETGFSQKKGIKRLRTTQNKGLLALINAKQMDISRISAYHVGFVLAPCLNAAGRLKMPVLLWNFGSRESK